MDPLSWELKVNLHYLLIWLTYLEYPFHWMNCFYCNQYMKFDDLSKLLTMKVLNKYAKTICSICSTKHTSTTGGENCGSHCPCATCRQNKLDKKIQCKICNLYGQPVLILNTPFELIKSEFDNKISEEVMEMFKSLTKSTKIEIHNLKLNSCVICGATVTIKNSIPLGQCGHYICTMKHGRKTKYECMHLNCRVFRKPIINVNLCYYSIQFISY